MSREAHLKSHATELGFDACRIARADEAWAAGERLAAFVDAGRHGEMAWMAETLERRAAPTAMWPEARSAVMVAMSYGPGHDPMENLAHGSRGNISVYARGADYHDLLKKRLKQLARGFAEETGEQVKVFVDTAPLMEKPLAERAGLGWQGKHTNLVSRALGNWTFLGAMLTAAELEPDAPETDHCGSCSACLAACPTEAFPAPYQLDARRCISYLTIEHKGPIPHEFRPAMGNRIYGCDDCLAVCPWNKFAVTAREAKLQARPETTLPQLADLARLEDAGFREIFSGSPVKRTGRARFIRNVAIAIGNSGEQDLAEVLMPLLGDDEPLVRGAAIWALARLDADMFQRERAARETTETDSYVSTEWHHGAAELA
ncbi:MAG: tRNA epoxyqueuosine(34) reductase QueG [Hyphomonadaceae bacterium]|nr:tRNA epoxyqueuosine(34) reductase QueG [Hyphomonadaceae bacterium]